MNIFVYYIMTQRIDMRLTNGHSLPKKPRARLENVNSMLQPSQQRVSPFNGNIFKGNMNGVFDARGRPCG